MKIAQVCHRYHPFIGGVETHVKEISERMASLGHEVEVITTDPNGDLSKNEMINGVKITRFRSFAPGEAYYFAPQIYFYFKKNEYDVIHAHNYHALPAFFTAMAKGNRKFVFTPHYHRGGHTFVRNLLHKPYKILGNMIFTKADSVVCVSDYEKGLVTDDFAIDSEKIQKIPNGINLSEFEHVKTGKKNIDRKKLLYVGRLEEYKGVQHIIRALQDLPDYSLSIIGKGPFEHELHKLADELRVDDHIEWLKDVSRNELLQHYASADVFLMLSKHEAYGITVAEALASGTPCVVALGSALDEFVDGKMSIGMKYPISTERLRDIIKEFNSYNTNQEPHKILLDWNEITRQLTEIYKHKKS